MLGMRPEIQEINLSFNAARWEGLAAVGDAYADARAAVRAGGMGVGAEAGHLHPKRRPCVTHTHTHTHTYTHTHTQAFVAHLSSGG